MNEKSGMLPEVKSEKILFPNKYESKSFHVDGLEYIKKEYRRQYHVTFVLKQ